MERVPILIVRPEDTSQRRPLVISFTARVGNKESQHAWLVRVARLGMIGLAIDARYHGERAGGAQGAAAYVAAITAAWKTKPGEPQEHPFYFDTVWDLWRVLDYVGQRSDVDPRRVAMVGFSMGGIETWLAGLRRRACSRGRPRDQRSEFPLELGARPLARPCRHDPGRPPRSRARLGRARSQSARLSSPLDQDHPRDPRRLRLPEHAPLIRRPAAADRQRRVGFRTVRSKGARVAFAAAEKAYKEAGASDRLSIDVASGVGQPGHIAAGKADSRLARALAADS